MTAPNRFEYFGGSFDPLTMGGIDLAWEVFNQDLTDVIIFSPCGKHADGKEYMGSKQQRLDLIQMGVNHLNRYWRQYGKLAAVWRGEINQVEDCRSYEALIRLRNIFPHATLRCLIGGDLLSGLQNWQEWEKIAEEFGFDVYPREESDMGWIPKSSRIIKAQLVNGASRKLKALIEKGVDIRGWVLPEQEAYMRENGCYGFKRQNY